MAVTAGLHLLRKLPVALAASRQITTSVCVLGIRSRWMAPLRKELYKRQRKMEKLGISHKTKRSEFIEWNYDAELFAFNKRLNEEIDDGLLREAFTDSSYIAQEIRRQESLGVQVPALQMRNNTDLAASGSQIISNYLSVFLRAALPLFPEEGIRCLVEYLTSLEVMSDVGSEIGLKDLILCEEYPPSPQTLAKSFQAIVGALSASSSLTQAQTFVKDFVLTKLVGKDINEIWEIEHPMLVLKDILDRSERGEPEPRLIFESGKSTIQAVYQVGIYSNKEFMGAGYGETVDTAVDQAARDCLRRFFQTTDAMPPLPLGKKASVVPKQGNNLALEEWSLDKAHNIITC